MSAEAAIATCSPEVAPKVFHKLFESKFKQKP